MAKKREIDHKIKREKQMAMQAKVEERMRNLEERLRLNQTSENNK